MPSSNWAGFVNEVGASGYFTGIKGHFRVSATSGTDNSAWVGIGGWAFLCDNDCGLIQAGIDAQDGCLWYEMITRSGQEPAIYPNMPCGRQGHLIQVEIIQLVAGSWRISLRDGDTGESFVTDVAFSPDQHSAEWIFESQPGKSVGAIAPQLFSHSQWRDKSGQWWPITATGLATTYRVSLHDDDGGYACAFDLLNGVSFNVGTDRAAPNQDIATQNNAVLIAGQDEITGIATDDCSGVESVTIRLTGPTGTIVRAAQLSGCNETRDNCDWSWAVPLVTLPGTYEFRAQALDRVGRLHTGDTVRVIVI